MAWNSTVPKGCPGINYRPRRYTNNVWSSELTNTVLDPTTTAGYDCWLYYDMQKKPSGVTGKIFTMDIVLKFETNVYSIDLENVSLDVSFAFYSILKQSWSEYFVFDGWQISYMREGNNSTGLWDNYRSYGDYRPAWGMHNNSGGISISASGPSYASYKAQAQAIGIEESSWHIGPGDYYSYARGIPWGVRYLSNGMAAMAGSRFGNYPDPGGIITRHGQQVGSQQAKTIITQEALDKGGTKNGIKTIDLTPSWIESKMGTLTGVTAFKMRIRLGLGTNGNPRSLYQTWYFGHQSAKDKEGYYTQLDNPQMGLLDYGPKGNKSATWPPRFDAQAVYRNKGGAVLKLQTKYKTKDGTWSIF